MPHEFHLGRGECTQNKMFYENIHKWKDNGHTYKMGKRRQGQSQAEGVNEGPSYHDTASLSWEPCPPAHESGPGVPKQAGLHPPHLGTNTLSWFAALLPLPRKQHSAFFLTSSPPVSVLELSLH